MASCVESEDFGGGIGVEGFLDERGISGNSTTGEVAKMYRKLN